MFKGIITGILAGIALVGTILATTGSAEARYWRADHGSRPSFRPVASPQTPSHTTFNCPRCSDGQQRPSTGPSQWGGGHNSHYGWGKSW